MFKKEAAKRGILIEPDRHYYAGGGASRNCFRMGVTSIPREKIREGVQHLRELMWDLSSGEAEFLDDSDPGFLREKDLLDIMCESTWIYKTVYGDPTTFELHEDGSMTGRAGHANEEQDKGRWWIEGDLWCRQWNSWAYGEESRYYLCRQKKHLKIYNTDKRLVDSAILHLHTD